MLLEYRAKIIFVCRYGSFKLTVIALGQKNVPKHLKWSISLILHDLLDDGALVYLANFYLC